MESNATLALNAGLTAEEFEDEIVLLDVARGLYFSLGGSAMALWRAFARPRAAAEAVEALCARLSGADCAALWNALESLRENGLLLPAEAAPDAVEPLDPAPAAFAAPSVEVFKDLADLISIDPVHEVDAGMGWPVKQENFPDAD